MAGFDGLGLFPVEIDVYKKHKVSTINAHEDDANGRGLLVTLLKDGVPFNTTGIDLKLAFRNAIGEERLFAFNTVDLTNGKYSVTYPREMLEGNGGRVVRVEIKAYDTATQAMISYSPLNVYVSEAVVTEGQLVTNSEGSEFVQLLERVETVETGLGNLDPVHIANVVTLSENAVQAEADRVLAESGRVSAESSRASAESGRASAENARTTAESDRVSAESSRVSVENARVLSENARVSSEDTRVLSESARVSAETTRATAEGVRANAESNRQTAESARVVAESSRVNAESARSSNESERILHEDDRVADEALRASAESTRISNETARGTAESNRVNAESARVNAESSRVTAETGRNNAESSRVTAEQGRVTAEQTRASFYDGFNAQLADIENGIMVENILRKDVSKWEPLYGSVALSESGGNLIATGTGSNKNPQFKQQYPVFTGRPILRLKFKVNSANCTMVSIHGIHGTDTINITDFIVGQWYDYYFDPLGNVTKSDIIIITRYPDELSSNGQSVEFENITLVNSTALLGYSDGKVANFIKDEISKTGYSEKFYLKRNYIYTFFYDVKTLRDFGARGDGTTDDSVAIQKALDKGGFIFVGDGVYKVTKTMFIKSNTKIIGLGERSKFILGDNYTLTAKQWSALYNVDYYPIFTTLPNATSIDIADIFIEGNLTQFTNHLQVGLALETAKNVKIKNVKISKINYFPASAPARPSGQWRTGWNFGALRSEDIEVDGGLFEYGGYECFRVTENTKRLTLKNAKLNYGWRTVFQITHGCEDIKLVNCDIIQDDFNRDDTHAAVTLHSVNGQPVKNVLIKDNRINGKFYLGASSYGFGIAMVDQYNENIRIEDNKINSNGGGIQSYGKEPVIKNNTIVASDGRGIMFNDIKYPGNNIALNGNTITSKHMGISVESGTTLAIAMSDNEITSQDEHCVYVYNPGVTVNKCKVSDNILNPNALKSGIRFVSPVENGFFIGNRCSIGDYGINLVDALSKNNILSLNNFVGTTSGINAPVNNVKVNNI